MIMRNANLAAGLALVLGATTAMQPARAQTPAAGVQFLFVGDKTCPDAPATCVFTDVTAAYRYLHVIVHYEPTDDEWQVHAGMTCAGAADVAGRAEIGPDGWREDVVDLSALPTQLSSKPACYVFRGRSGYDVTYYAAYFDNSASPDADTVFPHRRDLGGRPDLPDLDVQLIHRTPIFPYDGKPSAPSRGQAVEFAARVANVGARPSRPFGYAWLLDGVEVASGIISAPLVPGSNVELHYPWRWDPTPHDLELRVTPSEPDASSTNNRLTIRTNALLLGFWVEKSAYAYFNDHQWLYCSRVACAGSNSFEDWLQRQVQTWNALFASSLYPGFAPNGVADRVALDEVVVVPDGSLPLHGGGATYSPDLSNRTVDLEWGLPAANVSTSYPLHWENPFDVNWGMIHELNHARSLADLYRFDIGIGPPNRVDVVGADGLPAVDSAGGPSHLHSFVSGRNEEFLYQNAERDLMSCPCTPTYSLYSVLTLNRLRNRRARCGNTSPPCNLGDWYRDMPPVSSAEVADSSGKPVVSGELRLFFDAGGTYNAHAFSQTNSQTLPIRGGKVLLPADPFHGGGNTGTAGHNLLLIELIAPGIDEFCFQEPTAFNLAYWIGYRDRNHPADFTLRAGHDARNGCLLDLPPARVNEPFATSPFASRVRLAGWQGTGRRRRARFRVDLVDDSVPAHPMRNRQVEVEDRAGHVLATAVTNRSGVAVVLVPAGRVGLSVVDSTDNQLTIAQGLQTRSR